MKKLIPYIIGFVVLIGVLVAINPRYFQIFYSYIFNTKSVDEKNIVEDKKIVPVIQNKTITDTDPLDKWKFTATYPVFDNTLGKKWSAINSQIEAEVQVIKLQKTGDVSSNISPENAPADLRPFEITITSDATTSEKFGTVSVLFTTFVEGGFLAHPFTNYESHTFGLNDGAERSLKDLFTGVNFFSKLSDISTLKLKDYYLSAGSADNSFLDKNDGLTGVDSNFSTFMLSGDNLILQFAEYQLGSRPYGAPRIEIPISSLTVN
ncbi:MAG: RsiV family protein [Candidatus Paceibacterota bacterium]